MTGHLQPCCGMFADKKGADENHVLPQERRGVGAGSWHRVFGLSLPHPGSNDNLVVPHVENDLPLPLEALVSGQYHHRQKLREGHHKFLVFRVGGFNLAIRERSSEARGHQPSPEQTAPKPHGKGSLARRRLAYGSQSAPPMVSKVASPETQTTWSFPPGRARSSRTLNQGMGEASGPLITVVHQPASVALQRPPKTVSTPFPVGLVDPWAQPNPPHQVVL